MKRFLCILALVLGMQLLWACAPVDATPITAVRHRWHNQHSLCRTRDALPDWLAPGEPVTLALTLREAVRLKEGGPAFESVEYYLNRAAALRLTPPELRTTPWRTVLCREDAMEILYRTVGGNLDPINTILAIPDFDETQPHWQAVHALYSAGIYGGCDTYGTLNPKDPLVRDELRDMLYRIQNPAGRLSFTLDDPRIRLTKVYGQSGAGRDLIAYQYGEGKNVLVLSFAIHGWEDNWNADGEMLVQTAELLRKTLDSRYDLVEDNDWTVYILPCLNPDGLNDGYSCNADGRRTTYHYDWDGTLVEGGIDMNRSFPYIYYNRYDSRNYNGPRALSSPEAQALAEFTQSVMGDGNNVLIDTHGWYSQIIVSGGWGCPIYEAFAENFPNCYYTSLYGSAGYYSAWAAYTLGYDAGLFEFPHVSSPELFHEYELDERYVDSILWLLENYE